MLAKKNVKDMATTLIATLGATWQVIPEIVGLVLPGACPIYQNHPEQKILRDLRRECGDPDAASTQLWIVTSSSQRTQSGIEKIREWNRYLEKPLSLRFFVAPNTDEVTSEAELIALRELVLRVVLEASHRGDVACSLAGGRKTMSADLQYAASVFGARALLHIVAPEPMPDQLKCNSAEFWANPLKQEYCEKLLPAFIGRYERREILDMEPRFKPSVYPADPTVQDYGRNSLSEALLRREQDAGSLLTNFFSQVAREETHENWRNLYRLPPRDIDRMRHENVDRRHERLIRSLPKAELHCHLGGLPNLDEQITVGQAIWQSLDEQQKARLCTELRSLLDDGEWEWDWPATYLRKYDDPAARAERAACLLTQVSRSWLEFNLYTATEPRVALNDSVHGFSAYERPGELTGSSVLGHPESLPAYCKAIHRYVNAENIVYLELRGSPHKYRPNDPAGWLREFHQTLMKEKDAERHYRFIWILDRRYPGLADDIVREAVSASEDSELKDFIIGLDLAGDESNCSPETLAPKFLPAFERCLSVTIHAGEGKPAENIWQAAYHLNADRIGHGLSLVDNPELLARFRDRNICLELCPTSNVEVIGFSSSSEDRTLPKYPVEALWRSGVPLTLNTDNPGISRTGLTAEYLKAAELWGEMSLWDCLAIIKQGFVHAMASADKREEWLKECDNRVYKRVRTWLRE